MSDEAIALRGVPADAFKNTVAEYAPRSLIPACPGDKPKWMTGLISSGCELCLGPMVIEAGRHYADSINLDVFPESHTPRQAAAELAWQQIAMLRPEVKNRRLVVKLNVDPDIRRTTSELLGVGASLSLLDKAGAIDARTIEKMSARFDYEARDRDGNGPVSIEAKGTFESSSTQNHRESFVGKLKALMETGAIRGYSRAIGAIFSTWSTEAPDGVDFELMDPPGTGAGGADEAMRAIIRFYARRFDEVTGLYKAADSLWKLAHYEDLFEPGASLNQWLGSHQTMPGRFSRNSMSIEHGDGKVVFWGTTWSASAVPCIFGNSETDRFTFAYTGIDNRVIQWLRQRNFGALMRARFLEGTYVLPQETGPIGRLVATGDGVIRGWFSRMPPMRLKV